MKNLVMTSDCCPGQGVCLQQVWAWKKGGRDGHSWVLNPSLPEHYCPFFGSTKGINDIFNFCVRNLIPEVPEVKPAAAEMLVGVAGARGAPAQTSAGAAEHHALWKWSCGFWLLVGWILRGDKCIWVLFSALPPCWNEVLRLIFFFFPTSYFIIMYFQMSF